MKLYIYHVRFQDHVKLPNYDYYSDYVCIASGKEIALSLHPKGDERDLWIASNLIVQRIGTARDIEIERLVCSSFHAG